MNIKKYTSKAMSVMLCMAMALGSVVPASAAEVFISEDVTDNHAEWTSGESRYEDIEVTYNQASSYQVTIPKTIALDANKQSSYSIKVEGDIAANEQVCVVPVDGIKDTEVLDFYMRDQTEGSAKEAVPAEINQSKFYWDSEEAAASYEETNNYIVAEGLSAGSWKGIFQMEISLRTDTSHIHNYVGTITKEPTCTEAGEKTYICDCGDSYTEEISAKGHHYVDGECTDCGDKNPDYHTHNYVETITKEPTCTEAGEKTYTCACGGSYTEGIPATGEHNYVDGTCTGCGKKDPHTHDYEETITKGATCTEAGEKTYTCACGDSYTEEIPATGEHNYVDGICTGCGDTEDLYAAAPANAYLDWYYTLNDTDNTITLIKYLGKSTDVIVYSSYELNGKTYQTKIGNHMYANSSTYYMFYNNKTIKTVTFGNHIDFSDTTDIERMFGNCTSLTNIDFGNNFDTSNVTDMSYMFINCGKLTSLDLSQFNTSNVITMDNMFNCCSALKSLDLSNFNTGNVTNMQWMFRYCQSLTKLDLSNFDTSNVTTMYGMFSSLTLTSLDLSNFNTGNVTNMECMFETCKSLKNLDLSNFNTSNVTSMRKMFYYCDALTSIDMSSFDTGNVTDMTEMFSCCKALTSLDLSSFDTRNVNITDMGIPSYHMFYYCTSLKTIYVSSDKWTIPKKNYTYTEVYK